MTTDAWDAIEAGLRAIYDTVPQPKPVFREFAYAVRGVWNELAPPKAEIPPPLFDATFSAEQRAVIEQGISAMVLPVIEQMVRERNILLSRAAHALLWSAHHALQAKAMGR